MDYGTQLRVMREVLCLTQAEAAKKAGTSEKILGLIERGTIEPGYKMRDAIAVALDWPQEELADIAFGILDGQIENWDALDYEMRAPRPA